MKHYKYTTQLGYRNQFSFVCISFNTWQKLVNLFVYIKERISYSSVYLIAACVQMFA